RRRSTDLWILTCGRSLRPVALESSAILRRFWSKISESRISDGVGRSSFVRARKSPRTIRASISFRRRSAVLAARGPSVASTEPVVVAIRNERREVMISLLSCASIIARFVPKRAFRLAFFSQRQFQEENRREHL